VRLNGMDVTAAKNEKEATELKGAIKASKYVGGDGNGDGDGKRPFVDSATFLAFSLTPSYSGRPKLDRAAIVGGVQDNKRPFFPISLLRKKSPRALFVRLVCLISCSYAAALLHLRPQNN